MPMYSYTCSKCGEQSEEVVPYADRDAGNLRCQDPCKGKLQRQGVERINLGRPGHQTAIVTGSGETVKGNFGGDYRMKRRKRG